MLVNHSFFVLHLWLYTISTVFGNPIETPDISKCKSSSTFANCCPPPSSNIVDFQLPPPPKILRQRPAAHLVDDKYIAKYVNATRLMKNLPSDHPWNFMQQASIHCAYCEAIYNQSNNSSIPLQVHSSWFFFPFHRAYLYLYEQILAKLIEDDTFALPFWNWDAAGGMTMPPMYAINTSSLYDENRSPDSQPPNIMTYGFGNSGNISSQIDGNLRVMYRQMVSGPTTAELFLGGPYRAGDQEPSGPGSIETEPHSFVHDWTGDDMSSFVTAGRDPIFYAHHANVDRMWELWKTLPGGNRTDFDDPDWLDASFLFWDENMQLVRIRVHDVVNTTKLGYVYQDVPIPWLNATTNISERAEMTTLSTEDEFPLSLDSTVMARIQLPEEFGINKVGHVEEVLVVDIEFDPREHVKFDIHVSSASNPSASAFAGRFVNIPTMRWQDAKGTRMMKRRMKLGLTELMQELKVERSGSVFVTLVPRTKNATVEVEGLRVDFSG